MAPDLPEYTSSRLYTIVVEPFSRVYIPAAKEPRYVVGVRAYNREELINSPEFPLGPSPSVDNGHLTLIEAVSRDVFIANLPIRRCCQRHILDETKNASGGPSFGFGPVVFPFEAPCMADLGGSWIYNTDPLTTNIYCVEFFFNDLWRP